MEDVEHFVLRCPAYAHHRRRLLKLAATDAAIAGIPAAGPARHLDAKRLAVALGKRVGCPAAEDKIDQVAKRYLRKAWNACGRLTREINTVLGTNNDVFTSPAR